MRSGALPDDINALKAALTIERVKLKWLPNVMPYGTRGSYEPRRLKTWR